MQPGFAAQTAAVQSCRFDGDDGRDLRTGGHAIGYFLQGGKGYGGYGYPFYALNVLAPFDPYTYGLTFPPAASLSSRPSRRGIFRLQLPGVGVIFARHFPIDTLRPPAEEAAPTSKSVGESLCPLLPGPCPNGPFDEGSGRPCDSHGPGPTASSQAFSGAASGERSSFWAPYYIFLTAVLAGPSALSQIYGEPIIGHCAGSPVR